MAVQFAVLASGSRGNAALVKAGGAGVLVDLGLGPRMLEARLASVGACWGDVHAAVLTHTHGDHVDSGTLGRLASLCVPLYCHEGHVPELSRHETFPRLESQGLIRSYDDRPFLAPCGVRIEPIELSHDGGPTYGFRIEGRPDRRSRPVAIGYLADTGTWVARVADALIDVDLLAVEFNHDVDLQRSSGRSRYLIERNLGNRGHLSNAQGAALVRAVLTRSGPGGPRHVVLLHLSEQCNRAELAVKTAREAVRGLGRRVEIHAALQATASPNLSIAPRRSRLRPRPPRREATLELPF